MSRASGHPARLLPRLLCLALLVPAAPALASGPSVEYGPEVESRFLVACAGPDMMTGIAAACRRAMERLQADLGYEAFVEQVSERPQMAIRAGDAARRLALATR